MTNDEINHTIAAVCDVPMFGLKKRGMWYRAEARGYTDRKSEAGRFTKKEAKEHEYKRGGPDERVVIFPLDPPNYSEDLNIVCAAVDDWLRTNEISGSRDLSDRQGFYVSQLQKVCWGDNWYTYILTNATARQRAQAFLLMIGKWKP